MAARWIYNVSWALLALAGIICFALAARAGDDVNEFELSPEQLLDATVVSVSKTPEKVMDAPAAIYVLTNEEIMRSGATNVPEALRQVPGVQVAQVNAANWAISVRGFNSSLADKLLVLIDGREVYDPLFSGVYWDVQNLVLEDIDRIEVIRGPGASLWGANAVNGVINIITKKAEETQGNMLSLTSGTEAHAIVEERYGGKIGDLGYYRIFGKYTDLASEDTQSGGNAHDGQMQQQGGFRADWKAPNTRKDDFTFQGDVYRSTDGDMRSVPTSTAPFSTVATENILATGGNLLGRWNHTYSDDSHFTLQSFVDYASRDQIILGDQRSTFDLDAQYELPQIGAHKIIVGGSYNYSLDRLTATPYATYTNVGDSMNLFSSFVQDKITLDPNAWFLTLGTKLEHNDYTGFEVQPNARMQWQPDETQSVWASVSRAVRTPSRLEEALTIDEGVLSGIELKLVPNTGFDSEQLIAYELGYRNQITPTLLLDTTAFYNDYTHLATDSFTQLHLSPPFFLAFDTSNFTSGETHGFEMTTDWRAMKELDLAASYTVLQMNLFGPPANQAINSEANAADIPTQQFNIRPRWNVTKDITFDPSLYYTAAQRGLDVPEYWTLDAHLGWRVMDGLQFSLVGQDLLHGVHREFTSSTDTLDPKIGRSFYGNLTWRY